MAQDNIVTLTADGASNAITIKNPNTGAQPVQNIVVTGTFDSGTAAIEVSYDSGTSWFALTGSAGAITFSESGGVASYLLGSPTNSNSEQTQVRMNLSGAGSPSLTMKVTNVR